MSGASAASVAGEAGAPSLLFSPREWNVRLNTRITPGRGEERLNKGPRGLLRLGGRGCLVLRALVATRLRQAGADVVEAADGAGGACAVADSATSGSRLS